MPLRKKLIFRSNRNINRVVLFVAIQGYPVKSHSRRNLGRRNPRFSQGMNSHIQHIIDDEAFHNKQYITDHLKTVNGAIVSVSGKGKPLAINMYIEMPFLCSTGGQYDDAGLIDELTGYAIWAGVALPGF